ncbi:hypothetical protein H0H93_016863 [Arthromyces matolae]|nr:hypothetical protein H0H93_016863 [Arthromyces matolae]
MLALRRLRVPATPLPLLRRTNTTIQSATNSVTPSPPPTKAKPKAETPAAVSEEATDSTTNGRRRRRNPIPPKRPNISFENPRKWNAPLAPGVIPAYDLALQVIERDSQFLIHEAAVLRKEIGAMELKVKELGGWGSDGAKDVEAAMEKKREKLKIVEIQSQINLPDCRWNVNNAMADMTNPAHRHLVEQKWRKDGDLDLLMERLHQMHVIPDVLPDLRPTIDVHVAAEATLEERAKTKKLHFTVEPGTFLLPYQTFSPPSVYANVFHTDTRLYTMLLVDPDVPDETTQSFRTYLHWLKPNVPLSATTSNTRIRLNGHTPYIPPHPQQGTPYHRYVLLLLPQPPLGDVMHPLNTEACAEDGVPTSVTLDIPPVEPAERSNFDVRSFVERWGLNILPGGGAHMWREIWTPQVSKIVSEIHSTILKEPEPRFGRQPKEDPYLEYKLKKRYI